MGSKKKGGAKSKAAKTNKPEDEYAAQPATAEAAVATEPEPATEAPAPAPKPKKSKAKKEKPAATEASGGLTVYDISERYLAWLDQDGAGSGTIASYGMELKLAQRELGETTLVADLTPERVQEYFDSPAVMTTRAGQPKAPPTFKKTQRVLRLALVWAAEEGLIEKAPIPEAKKPTALKAV